MTAAFRYEVPSMYTPKQFNLDNAVRIKAGVHIPVAGGGRIVDPETAAPYVEDGRLDMIFVGRPQICDPNFAIRQEKAAFRILSAALAAIKGVWTMFSRRGVQTCDLSEKSFCRP